MENKIIDLLKERKLSGKDLAFLLKISTSDLRYFIAKIRRNWDGYGFLIADENGYWISYNWNEIEKYQNKVKVRLNGLEREYNNIISGKVKTFGKKEEIIIKLKKDYLLEEEIIKFDNDNIWDTIDLVKEYEKLFKKYNVGAIRHRVEEYTLSDLKTMLLIEAGWD